MPYKGNNQPLKSLYVNLAMPTYSKVGNKSYHAPRGLMSMIWPMGSNSHRID